LVFTENVKIKKARAALIELIQLSYTELDMVNVILLIWG
jgi:hypothetical protein